MGGEAVRLPEDRIRHLEMIQSVITRMASSSAMTKNLCMIICAGALAFAAQNQNPEVTVYAAVLTAFFWFLDAKYLQQEKWFRDIYNREKDKPITQPADFVITPNPAIMGATTVAYGFKSWSTRAFYPPLIMFLLVVTIVVWYQPPSTSAGGSKNGASVFLQLPLPA